MSSPTIVAQPNDEATQIVQKEALFGRQRNLALFLDILKQLQDKQKSRIIVFAGEDGSGKSMLLNALSELAKERGTTVLSSQCEDQSKTNPYHPFFRAMGLTMDKNGKVVPTSMVGIDENMVVNIIRDSLPILFAVVPGVNIISSAVPLAMRLSSIIFEQRKTMEDRQEVNPNWQFLRRVIEDIYKKVQTPVCLILDDLNLASPTTIDIVDFLMDSSASVFFLAGWNLGTPQPGRDSSNVEMLLPDKLQKLLRKYQGRADYLPPLNQADALAYIARLDTGNEIDQQLRERIVRLTRGYPATIAEVVKYIHDGGDRTIFTENVDRTLSAEDISSAAKVMVNALAKNYIGNLTDNARNLLEAAALVGRTFPISLLAQPAIRDYFGTLMTERNAYKTLLGMAQAGQVVSYIEGEDDELQFTSDFFRSYMLNNVPPALRRRDHLRIAQAWEKIMQADQAGRLAVQLGYHYTEGGDLAIGSNYYLRAAAYLTGEKSYREAADAYTSALKALEAMVDTSAQNRQSRVTTLVGLGFALEQLHEYDDACNAYERALELSGDDRKRTGEIHSHLGYLAFKMGNQRDALQHYDAADAIYRDLNDTEGKMEVNFYKATLYTQQRAYARALETLDMLVELALNSGKTDDLDLYYIEMGRVHSFMGHWDQAEKFIRQGLALAEQQQDNEGQARAYHMLGLVSSRQGKPESLDHLQKAIKLLDEGTVNQNLYAEVMNTLAQAYTFLSRWDEALQTFKQAADLKERLGDKFGLGIAYGGLGRIYTSQWQFDQAILYFQKDVALLHDELRENAPVVNQLLNQIAECYTLSGDVANALDFYQSAYDVLGYIADPTARSRSEGFTRLGMAKAYLAAANQEGGPEMMEMAGNEVSKARQLLTMPFIQSELDRVEAQLERKRGQLDQAKQLIDRATTNATTNMTDHDRALLLLETADLARERGDKEAARHLLSQIQEIGQRLGNKPLQDLTARTLNDVK